MSVIKFVLGGLLVIASLSLKDLVYYSALHNDTLFFSFSLVLCLTAAICGLMLIADSLITKPEKARIKLSAKEVEKIYDSDYKEKRFF